MIGSEDSHSQQLCTLPCAEGSLGAEVLLSREPAAEPGICSLPGTPDPVAPPAYSSQEFLLALSSTLPQVVTVQQLKLSPHKQPAVRSLDNSMVHHHVPFSPQAWLRAREGRYASAAQPYVYTIHTSILAAGEVA